MEEERKEREERKKEKRRERDKKNPICFSLVVKHFSRHLQMAEENTDRLTMNIRLDFIEKRNGRFKYEFYRLNDENESTLQLKRSNRQQSQMSKTKKNRRKNFRRTRFFYRTAAAAAEPIFGFVVELNIETNSSLPGGFVNRFRTLSSQHWKKKNVEKNFHRRRRRKRTETVTEMAKRAKA